MSWTRRGLARSSALAVLASAALLPQLTSCSSGSSDVAPAPSRLGPDRLDDPTACQGCHPNQYREWSGSMHAYAGEDPVFLAMNRRMQRETGGALGPFCVQCHAPMAVRTGATTDGLNLAELPAKLRGVGCFFCHTGLPSFQGKTENDPIELAGDGVMRGGIANPVPNTAHVATYSKFHDREAPEGVASVVCGTCHDIVTGHGAKIERTFEEWTGSLYARGNDGQALACGRCHMASRIGVAAQAPGVFLRRVHDHSMFAVDLALQPFPEQASQRASVQRFLDGAVSAALCVQQDTTNPDAVVVDVGLRNLVVGHNWPSGSAQDRRAWVEVVATRGGNVVYASGQFNATQAITTDTDRDLFLMRDTLFDQAGAPTRMFWQAASFTSTTLPPIVSPDPNGRDFDQSVHHQFHVSGAPDLVTMVVHLRPIDVDLLEDLKASGDLPDAAALESQIPTYTLEGTRLAWRASQGFGCVP